MVIENNKEKLIKRIVAANALEASVFVKNKTFDQVYDDYMDAIDKFQKGPKEEACTLI